MKKGKMLIILPSDVEIPFDSLESLKLPLSLTEIIEEDIAIIQLPRGGSLFFGDKAEDLIKEFRDRLDYLLKKGEE